MSKLNRPILICLLTLLGLEWAFATTPGKKFDFYLTDGSRFINAQVMRSNDKELVIKNGYGEFIILKSDIATQKPVGPGPAAGPLMPQPAKKALISGTSFSVAPALLLPFHTSSATLSFNSGFGALLQYKLQSNYFFSMQVGALTGFLQNSLTSNSNEVDIKMVPAMAFVEVPYRLMSKLSVYGKAGAGATLVNGQQTSGQSQKSLTVANTSALAGAGAVYAFRKNMRFAFEANGFYVYDQVSPAVFILNSVFFEYGF